MRHRKGSRWETMWREALTGVSTGDGVAAAHRHKTNHSMGHHKRIQGQTAEQSLQPSHHHRKADWTTLLAILHQPKKGGGSTLL